MKPWFKDNLKGGCVFVPASLDKEIPLPPAGEHEGDLYVSYGQLGNTKIFGKVIEKLAKWEVCSLFKVEVRAEGTSTEVPSEKSILRLIRSDDPQERSVCWEITNQCYGDVLVVGAGIGVVPGLLQVNDNVSSVRVLEEEPEVLRLIAKQFDSVRFIEANYFDSIPEVQEKFDCIVIHPWNSFHFEMLPFKNLLAGLCALKLKDLAEGKVFVWGYARSLQLYTEQCKLLLKKAKRNTKILRAPEAKMKILRKTEPMTAACFEFLREAYMKDSFRKDWAPGVRTIEKLARATALSVRPIGK